VAVVLLASPGSPAPRRAFRSDPATQATQEFPRAVANIKSQKKRNRQNEVRHARNKAVRSELKTRVKRARTAIDTGAQDAADAVRMAQKRLAKAGAKGRIHKNQASRRIARLMRRQAKAGTQA